MKRVQEKKISKTTIRIALAQIAPKMGDIEGNFSKVFSFVERAKKGGADLVVFPELATAGYLSQGLFLETPEKEESHLDTLLQISTGIYSILGIVEESDMGILYNSAIVVGRGRLSKGYAGDYQTKSYRKCYLPTYGMFEERRWFSPGERVPVFPIKIDGVGVLKVGLAICEDFWHPLPSRIAALRGADVLFFLSSSPKTLSKPHIVDALITTRAVENTTYIGFVNSAGSQDMVNFWGGSKLISPEGEVLAKGRLRYEDLVFGEIDLYRLRKVRQTNPMLRDERREMLEDYLRAYQEMRDL